MPAVTVTVAVGAVGACGCVERVVRVWFGFGVTADADAREESMVSTSSSSARSSSSVASRVAVLTAACVVAAGCAGARAVDAATTTGKPELNTLVTSRARVFSAGLDPFLEATAASWFENLGFLALESTTRVGAGVWGGAAFSADASLATSYCLDADVDTATVDNYDFVSWLPTPSVIEDLFEDYPDAKVVLFESMVSEWYAHAETQAKSAAELGDACGCASGAIRSSSSACGDETYHYCDIYPCMYERLFGSEVPDEETWKSAYIDRVREIKSAIPVDSLLVVPMTTSTHSHAHAVKIAKVIGEFLSITDDVDKFGETYPFMTRNLVGKSLDAGARFWIVVCALIATWVIFFCTKRSPVRRFFRRLLR